MSTSSFAKICISALLCSASSSSVPQGKCTTGCAAAKFGSESLLLQVSAAENLQARVAEGKSSSEGGGPAGGAHDKDARIAIVGAGAAGMHMGSRLKQLGYTQVTIFEKTDRVGGKCFTLYRDADGNKCEQTAGEDGVVDTASCVAQEMGATFLHNAYDHTRYLIEEYGLQEVVALPLQSWAIWENNFGNASVGLPEVIQAGIQKALDDGHLQKPMNLPDIPEVVGPFFLLEAAVRYYKLYASIFGDVKFNMPDRLSTTALDMISKTFEQFLQDNKLYALINLVRVTHTAQGYGYIQTAPAYYGLMLLKPVFLAGLMRETFPPAGVQFLLQQLPEESQGLIGLLLSEVFAPLGDSAGSDMIATTMVPEGFQKIWQRVHEQDQLDVRFNVEIAKIQRAKKWKKKNPIKITYSQSGGDELTEKFDLLIYTAPHALAGDFVKLTKKEKKIFKHLSQYILMATVYESSPVVGYSDEVSAKSGMFNISALDSGSEDDGLWYADRDDYRISGTDGARQANGKQSRVAFQFYEKPCSQPRNDSPSLCDIQLEGAFPSSETPFQAFKQPDQLKRLEEALRAKGSEMMHAEQFPWPYFWHFSQDAIDAGKPWDLLDLQGERNTFWLGASAAFETIHDVLNYNLQILDQHFGGQYQGDGAQRKAA